MHKILIIDDNAQDRELLEQVLRGASGDYALQTAGSGAEALEQISREIPDLIILDIHLNDFNGFQVLEELKRRGLAIPVLLISSFTGETERLQGLSLGVKDFITKPIVSEELQARVAVQISLKKINDDARWVAEETNQGIKILYKELERKNAELKKLDDLKSNFISMVSHELRTPLAILRQGASLMQRGVLGEINDGQRETLQDMLDSVDRLVRVINNILDMSKLEAGRMPLDLRPLDLRALISKVVKDFQPSAGEKAIQLQTQAAEDLPVIAADEDKVIQVLTNLVGNALKFTPAGGTVTVSAQADAERVRVAVEDTGPGISPEDLPKMFDKFQQFRRHTGGTKGTGLGLAISRELVRLHKGDIRVEPRPGGGTVFMVTLPLGDGETLGKEA